MVITRKHLDELHAHGKCDEVVNLLEPMLKEEHIEQPGLLFVLARCMADIGQYESSLGVLSRLLQYDPEHGKGWALKYWMHHMLNQHEQAYDCWEHLEFLGWTEEMLEQVRPREIAEPEVRESKDTAERIVEEEVKSHKNEEQFHALDDEIPTVTLEHFPWDDAVAISVSSFLRERLQSLSVPVRGFLSLFL